MPQVTISSMSGVRHAVAFPAVVAAQSRRL